MDLISAISTPFINATIFLTTSFVTLIWFSLSLIFALIEIINFMLGQPLIGWLITGNFNATNNLTIITQQGMFSFVSPMMIFLYIALIISILLFIVYWIYSMFQQEMGLISTRFIGLLIICLSIIWIPFLYSLLAIATSGLMLGLNSLMNLQKIAQISKDFDFSNLKINTINQLNQIKNLLNEVSFNKVDINNQNVQDFINQYLSPSNLSSFQNLINFWNQNLEFLNEKQIEKWISILNSINSTEDMNLFSADNKNELIKLASFSQNLKQMNSFYDDLPFWYENNSTTPNLLLNLNSIFIINKNVSLNLNEIKLTDLIFIKNSIGQNETINNLVFYILNNKNVLSNNFSQTIVNVLYSLSLGKNTIFVPGWDSLSTTGFNIFWLIPAEIKTPIANVTTHLFYNIKMLVVGTVINSILLPCLFILALTFLKRFLYIAFWPITTLILLARSGQGDKQFSSSINEIFYKFINIVALGLLWNFITVLVTAIFGSLVKINYFGNNQWIFEIFQVFLIIGIIFLSIYLLKEFNESLESNRYLAKHGANEIVGARQKMNKTFSQWNQQSSSSWKKSKVQINQNIQPYKDKFKDGFKGAKGQSFLSRLNAGRIAAFNTKVNK